MSVTSSKRSINVALIGNPNTGKSTLFNALCGARQRVGNYPGVTVEKKTGRVEFNRQSFSIIDLPGSYSLAPRSPDEMIAVDVLLGRRGDVERPDVVVCIVDAANLPRNLYLVSQVLELKLPTVVALNMIDAARAKGCRIDVERLRRQLGVPVLETQANRKIGLAELKSALAEVVESAPGDRESPFPDEFQGEVEHLRSLSSGADSDPLPRYLVERLLLDTSGYLAASHVGGIDARLIAEAASARERLSKAGMPIPGIEAMSRYAWVGEVLEGVVTQPATRTETLSDKLDHLLTHRIWGTAVFVLLMVLLFQAVFSVAAPASELIDALTGALGRVVEQNLADGPLRSLLLDGVIAGVGSVLVFLPQIFVLFLFIAVLEDCGDRARAAYLMDRLMSRVGLSGKSFIPLLSSFACAIPGVMAARVIENPRDRLVTILVAPLMSCSARLPVYTLLTVAFIPDTRYGGGWLGLQGMTMFAMYALGIVAAVLVALVLKKTILRGATPPFVMELPSYKLPSLRLVLHRMLERGWAFVRRAGTLIFAVAIVVWAAAYYPRDPGAVSPALFAERQTLQLELANSDNNGDVATVEERLATVENRIQGEYLRNSYLGRAGRLIEPLVAPLGWDWRIGCAAIASFPAREVVVATLGVIYNLGGEEDEESESLRETLRSARRDDTGEAAFNIPVALSIMVFFALCAQCAATLAVIKRETNSWRWPAFTFVYMTALAYVCAFAVFQIGSLIAS